MKSLAKTREADQKNKILITLEHAFITTNQVPTLLATADRRDEELRAPTRDQLGRTNTSLSFNVFCRSMDVFHLFVFALDVIAIFVCLHFGHLRIVKDQTKFISITHA